MKAYLKLVLIAAIAFACDRFAWAPQRESLAVCEDAQYDSPHCIHEMIERTLEMERSYGTATTRPALADLWEAAQVEHLRTCRHNHLADKFYRQHAPAHRDAPVPVHCSRAVDREGEVPAEPIVDRRKEFGSAGASPSRQRVGAVVVGKVS